jgi:hypothetical protein
MSLSQPPIKAPLLAGTPNIIGRGWQTWFSDLWRLVSPSFRLPAYTVATVPPATENTGGVVYVSDETGGAVMAFSDGTNWRRVTDRAVIS